MQEELSKLLEEAEAQHKQLVVLHAQAGEQINKFKEENKKLIHLLTISKGQIEAYRKSLELINQHRE